MKKCNVISTAFVFFMFAGSVIAQADIYTGLVGYWNFDEGSGTTAHDCSVVSGSPISQNSVITAGSANCTGPNAGILANNPIPITGVVGSGALQFNGTNTAVSLPVASPSLNITGAITVSAWVQESAIPTYFYPIVTKGTENGQPNQEQYYLGATNSGHVIFRVSNGTAVLAAGWSISQTVLTLNQWVHVVGVYDGSGTVSLYVDGVLVDSQTSANFGSLNSNIVGNQGFGIGGDEFFWDGSIDDVRIYNVALQPSDIQALYKLAIGNSPSAPNQIFYIAANGSDSNSGTSKSSPWLHAPGMTGCSATCAEDTPQPGDSFILRGGDSWHASAGTPIGLPWSWSWSGSSTSSPIYIGVDKTWFSGSSWTRPIMDLDNPLSTAAVAACVHDDTNFPAAVNIGAATDWPVNYITFDNFEFRGLCWSGPAPFGGAAYTMRYGTYITFSNNYFHGWSHTPNVCSLIGSASGATFNITASAAGAIISGTINTGGSGYTAGTVLTVNQGQLTPQGRFTINAVDANGAITSISLQNGGIGYTTAAGVATGPSLYCDTMYAMQGSAVFPNGNLDDNSVITGNIFDGTDTDQFSGGSVYADAWNFNNNIVKYGTDGPNGNNVHLVYNNVFYNVHYSYDPTQHTNVFKANKEAPSNNYYYNNIVINPATGVGFWSVGVAGFTDYYFNNVIYSDSANIDPQAPGATVNCWLESGGITSVYFMNNTFDYPCLVRNTGNSSYNPPFIGNEYYFNNHFIGYTALTGVEYQQNVVTTSGDGGADATFTESNNFYQTEAIANSQGYLPANNYAPTSASGSTIGAGENLTNLNLTALDTDLQGDPRPATGSWNIGAYQYTSSPVGPVVYGDVNSDEQVNILDAEMAAQASMGLITLSPTQQRAAEVNGKTSIDSNDANLIAGYAVGAITSFPVQGGT